MASTEDAALKPRATIREVASAAGVSIATVSRVLNGRPDVSPATREAVLRVVRDHQFATNRNAKALSGGRTSLIGVMLPRVEAPYFAHILAGAAEALHEHDMRVVLTPTLHLHDRAVTLLDRLLHRTTDGAVLMLPEETNEELKSLQRLDYPFVVVDPRLALDEGVPAVSAANTSGAHAAVHHLLELGHERVAAITGPSDWLASQERLTGYHSAHASAGVLADPALVLEADYTLAGGARPAALLLDLPDPPTAVFAFNDDMAVAVLQEARKRGLRVPDDLSVVGFDDSEQAAIVTPALTSVRQPLAEMGRMAISLLLRLLENQSVEGLKVELQTRLVVRASTAAPAVVSLRRPA